MSSWVLVTCTAHTNDETQKEELPVQQQAAPSSLEQRVEQFLQAELFGCRSGAAARGVDPDKAPCERYRPELRGDEPSIGAADALVTIVQYSDFQCSHCATGSGELMAAMMDSSDVRLIFKHLPLPGHTYAVPAARAAWAAHQQGRFWEMHDLLFSAKGELPEAVLQEHAMRLGLDIDKFDADRFGEASMHALDSDYTSGSKAGATGTPYFLVNGKPLKPLPAAKWREHLALERMRAQTLLDLGVSRNELAAVLMQGAKDERPGGYLGVLPSRRRDAASDESVGQNGPPPPQEGQ